MSKTHRDKAGKLCIFCKTEATIEGTDACYWHQPQWCNVPGCKETVRVGGYCREHEAEIMSLTQQEEKK